MHRRISTPGKNKVGLGAWLPVACRLYEKNAGKSRRSRTTPRPTKRAYTVLRQLVQWIPPGLADSLAKDAKADIRYFSAFSHVLALLHGQVIKENFGVCPINFI